MDIKSDEILIKILIKENTFENVVGKRQFVSVAMCSHISVIIFCISSEIRLNMTGHS